jgi:hypothetical protein
MYFEINVSLNGEHFFATAERSITTMAKCEKVYSTLLEKFPPQEGYIISVTRYETRGHIVVISR